MYDVALTDAYFPAQEDAEIRDITVGGHLREIAAGFPDNVAMVDITDEGDAGRTWSYAELLETSERLASALAHRFAPGEKVVVWAPNIPEWIFMEYACGLAGLVLVTANPSFQDRELRYVLEQSGAVGLFMIDEFRGNPMQEIAEKAVSGNTNIREVVNLYDNAALFSGCMDTFELPNVSPDNAAQIQYTSGKTGFPKGAVLSHLGLVNNARFYAERCGVTASSTWINIMPMFHTSGATNRPNRGIDTLTSGDGKIPVERDRQAISQLRSHTDWASARNVLKTRRDSKWR